jgi:diketogulonate reductase-like aldo/keto reductase
VEWFTSAAGIRMPKILYGTAWKKTATDGLVAAAIRQGFRGIDTACQPKHYEESGVGAGVAASLDENLTRADLYLQTKYTPLSGQDPTRIPYNSQAAIAEQVAQSFAVSLRNLRTDYIDCLVLHSPLPSGKQTQEAWAAMEALVHEGKVGQLGISNCYQLLQLEALYDGARIKPAVIQNRFYADTQYDRNIRAYCRRRHIIYQSFWTLAANPRVLASPTFTALADRYGRTAPQILFRYLTQIDAAPLTGTSSEQHMREALAIFEFQLDTAEIAQLTKLF